MARHLLLVLHNQKEKNKTVPGVCVRPAEKGSSTPVTIIRNNVILFIVSPSQSSKSCLWWKAVLGQMSHIHIQLARGSQYFFLYQRPSAWMHWYLQTTFSHQQCTFPDIYNHVPLWGKASTSPEWHLGTECDILYQHYTVQMGTNIFLSFMEIVQNKPLDESDRLVFAYKNQ